MNDTKQGFNGRGVINLEDYRNLVPRDQNNATFLHIEWLDLSTVDLTDEDYFNTAIRSESTEDFRNRVDSISLSYKQNGFSTRYWPPCFGTDGKPRDGRGRISAAIENGERFIPIAVYMYDDDVLLCVSGELNFLVIISAPSEALIRPELDAEIVAVGLNELVVLLVLQLDRLGHPLVRNQPEGQGDAEQGEAHVAQEQKLGKGIEVAVALLRQGWLAHCPHPKLGDQVSPQAQAEVLPQVLHPRQQTVNRALQALLAHL